MSSAFSSGSSALTSGSAFFWRRLPLVLPVLWATGFSTRVSDERKISMRGNGVVVIVGVEADLDFLVVVDGDLAVDHLLDGLHDLVLVQNDLHGLHTSE